MTAEPATLTEADLFDAQFLGSLRTLFFKLRKRAKLQRKGSQFTPTSGHTREFKDHRAYVPGDDYRSIDWKLYARMERIFIRIYEEIQEYNIHILFDRSTSMLQPWPAKRTCQLRLTVALAYLALISQHRVSLHSIADTIKRETLPIKGQGHLPQILKHLLQIPYQGTTNLHATLKQFRPAHNRRSIVFLLSDLLGSHPESALRALDECKSWPCETHIIQILEPHELRPNLKGELQLIDCETGESRRITLNKRELDAYEKRFLEHIQTIQTLCMKNQINYLTWQTNQPFEDIFLQLLSRGTNLAND